MIKKLLIASILVLGLVGCDTSMEGDTNTDVTNYTAEEGGVVVILNNDGSKECYTYDSNGTECAQDTYIELIFDGEEEAANAEAEAEEVSVEDVAV